MLASSERYIYGNPQPWLGLTLSTKDQQFGTTSSGKRVYSASMLADTFLGIAGLGIDIIIDGWDSSPSNDASVTLYYGDVRIRALGDPTRNLVRFAAAKLEKDIAEAHDCDKTTAIVECVALNGDPADMAARPLIAKLFIGEEGDPDESQIFLTVDASAERAWFGEKEREYEASLLKWLGRLAS